MMPGAGRVESQDGRGRVEPSQPGKRETRGKLAEVSLETTAPMGPPGVSVVVSRDDRHPRRVVEPARQGRPRRPEFVRQGRRRQVAGDQDVIGLEPADMLHQPGDSAQVEPLRPTRQQGRHPHHPLAHQPERVERVLPEMDV